ncbi:putative bifunctional diguanylate cyclase/phosphodiesterase [Undibacterium sp.]|uniref:putative bifunctional diguanylate cyclase/phosphodiesterase n=1 Tax=Undibacterium sp. TaxID=1914977 RepID=UPI002BD6FA7B|nr:EAL domain-containing protein [Undibacterium sp.]HTD04726.1 EAL domain-containing protein [Undibacterium sp.]
MNSNEEKSACDPDNSGRSDASSQAGSPAVAEKNALHGVAAAIDAEAALLIREELLAAREIALDLRENTARLREATIASLEREVQASDRLQLASDDQLIRLQQANTHLVIASIEAHKLAEQVETANDKLHHLAHHDVLTDLPNRMLLQDRIGQAIELAHRQGRKLAVMFMDLDRFKNINDSLGHAVGDQLLQSVARCLAACVRHSDTVSRQGGDEFVLLLPFIEHAEDAAFSAKKMLAALALPHHVDGHDLHISVSVGISIYPDDGEDAATLVKNADTAMYHAKEKGRDTYQFFCSDMNIRAVERQVIEASLRIALQKRQFTLYYQPKVNLDTGLITGMEALLRWEHPEWGLVLPARFMPIAEECGLIVPIGRWVLREACEQARRWIDAGLEPISVAVNISALEFRQKNFFDGVRSILRETSLDATYLQLEITESVLMRDVESSAAILQDLKAMGVQLAVDDFGTGYSSLSYLKKFPIDVLKIDKSFVDDIVSAADHGIIVSAVVGMGNSLKLRVVAEGVENQVQLAFLQAQHCEEGQGYFFSRPLAAGEFAKLLANRASVGAGIRC